MADAVVTPLIAVAGRRLEPGRVTGWSAGAVAVAATYTDALVRAGSTPVVLPPGAGPAALGPFAGLLLVGGADVDPARYGEEPDPSVYGVDPVLDDFESALVTGAIDQGLPVLAICRGFQLLNVVRGGTLVQHLAEGAVAHGNPHAGPGGGADHEVRMAPGSRLAEAVGGDRAIVRSHHHQAVALVGDGLVATAWAGDGVVEGLELDRADRWVVAVQWHPEMTAATDPVQQRLFDTFVQKSRQ